MCVSTSRSTPWTRQLVLGMPKTATLLLEIMVLMAANREALMSFSQFDAAAKAMKSDCASSFMLLGSVAHFVM